MSESVRGERLPSGFSLVDFRGTTRTGAPHPSQLPNLYPEGQPCKGCGAKLRMTNPINFCSPCVSRAMNFLSGRDAVITVPGWASGLSKKSDSLYQRALRHLRARPRRKMKTGEKVRWALAKTAKPLREIESDDALDGLFD